MMTYSQWLPVICIFCMLTDVATSIKEWDITIKQREFTVKTSSSITINCRVEYPRPETNSSNIQGFWMAKFKNGYACDRYSKDIISHTDKTLVTERFRGRTEALGKIEDNDCSLLISKIQSNDAGQYYFRVETGSREWSFCDDMITIKVEGHASNGTWKAVPHNFTDNPLVTTYVPDTSAPSTYIIIFICVPIILLVVVIVAVTVFLLRRRKRRRYPARQDSSYYVNFRPPCEMQQDGPKLMEKFEKKLEPPPFTTTPKDEPIYSNVQGKTLEEPAASEQMENIYSNVGSDVQC